MPKEVELFVGLNKDLKKITHSIPDDEPKPWDGKDKLRIVGKKQSRIDGHLKVSGKAKYTYDKQPEGMLYAKFLRIPVASGLVKKVDYSKAEKFPGVKAVLPVYRELPYQIRFAGQELVGVAAATLAAAEDAVKLIKYEIDKLPFVVDAEEAMKDGAHIVHEDRVERKRTEADAPEDTSKKLRQQGNVRGPNIASTPDGTTEEDIDKFISECDVSVSAEYSTQVQTHSPMETHGVVVQWEDKNRMKVWASTQGTFSVRREMAEYFELPEPNIQVITEFMGGGFGSKLGGGEYASMAGRLAKKTGKPVWMMLDRKEEHLCVGNRPNSFQKITIGAAKDGKIKVIKNIGYGTAGIGTGAGSDSPSRNLYRPEKTFTSSSDVFTNAGAGRAFRAPGHPQGIFSLEQATDELAIKLGMNPLDLKMKNLEFDEVRQYQLKQGAEMIGWKDKFTDPGKGKGPVKHGLGVASSIWYYIYSRNHIVTVEVHRDGTVRVKNGVQDIGGGIGTVLAMIVAEELGLQVSDIGVTIGDTNLGMGPASGGSQTTASLAPATRKAAYNAKKKLLEIAAPMLGTEVENVEVSDGKFYVKGDTRSGLSWKQVTSKIHGSQISAVGERIEDHRKYNQGVRWWIAGAQFADVSVDIETGQVKVNKIAAVHDCGRPMDRLTIESQVHGGIIQGLSYALFEDRLLDRNTGIMVNPNFEMYKIAGVKDVPQIDVEIVDFNQGQNAAGVVGIGEPATIPTSAAIANAIYNAIGVRMRHLPITPDKILNALYEGGET